MSSRPPFEPAEPFSTWAIQLCDREVGFAWYARKGTIVTQMASAHGTAYAARVLSDWIDLLLARHRVEIEESNGLLAIHDWRKVKKYDSDARVVWFERMRQRPRRYLRKAVVITTANPLLRMAIAGGNLTLALLSRNGSSVEIATNVTEVLRKYEVEPP